MTIAELRKILATFADESLVTRLEIDIRLPTKCGANLTLEDFEHAPTVELVRMLGMTAEERAAEVGGE